MVVKQMISAAAAGAMVALVAVPMGRLEAQSQGTGVKADSAFVQEAASGGLLEVRLGRLAQQKASSPAVKQFGRRMVADHSKANQQLKAVARQGGIALPRKLAPEEQQAAAKLSGMSGPAFDKAYMSLMVQDHTQDVQKFQQASKSASSEPVRQFTSQTVPILEQHLTEAKQVAAQVGADTTGTGQPGAGQR
jgi:putative membrane protein